MLSVPAPQAWLGPQGQTGTGETREPFICRGHPKHTLAALISPYSQNPTAAIVPWVLQKKKIFIINAKPTVIFSHCFGED